MINIIAALSDNYVIGNGPKIPWHIPEDFKQFKEKTLGNVLVMGRATFESIGKPLPKRTTIVMSRTEFNYEGVYHAYNLEEALSKARTFDKEIFIAGGGQIYKEALDADVVDRMYLSWVKGDYEGNVFFPKFDESQWKIAEEPDYGSFVLKTYERN